ncbi:MAG: type II toxin-antitoxin system RelE family toxin [Aggregatilineales bacterium]
MAYKWFLIVSDDAKKQIDNLSGSDLRLLFKKLIELLNVDDPLDQTQITDIKKLKAREYRGLWRKRAGNWRILYRVEHGEVVFFKFKYKGKLIVEQIVNRRDL